MFCRRPSIVDWVKLVCRSPKRNKALICWRILHRKRRTKIYIAKEEQHFAVLRDPSGGQGRGRRRRRKEKEKEKEKEEKEGEGGGGITEKI